MKDRDQDRSFGEILQSKHDGIFHLTAGVGQCFMQEDFDGAEYAIRKFFEKLEKDNERLKKKLRVLRKQLEPHQESSRKQWREDADYLSYAEREDGRD